MVGWMCDVKIKDKSLKKERERERETGIEYIISVLHQNSCDGVTMSCKKKIMSW